MRLRLVSANDKNVEVRDALAGYEWVFWIEHAAAGSALTRNGMNVLPNRDGEMPPETITAEAFSFAADQARRRGVTA